MLSKARQVPAWGWSVARAILWAWSAVGTVRTRLQEDGGVSVPVPAPASMRPSGIRGVNIGVRLRRASCLERSLVLQRWYLSHGRHRTVIIGVAIDASGTRAHAWLEGEEHRNDTEYVEMTRVLAS